MNTNLSPCISCTRVKDPRNCENKNCQYWRRWYIARWEQLRSQLRASMEQKPEPVGVSISGRTYAAPHQVQAYLEQDPCNKCLCPKDLCRIPCNLKLNWLAARKEVLF